MILEGKISVKAAILGKKREVNVIYCEKGRHDREIGFILAQAEKNRIPVEFRNRAELDGMAEGKTHGGILCEAGTRRPDDENVLFESGLPFVCVLEGAEDPFNLGYVIRSLYAGGCTGLILRKRNWENADPVILRSSAGAYDFLPIIESEDPASLIHKCRRHGMKAYAAMRKDAKVYSDCDCTVPVLLAIGGEMRGLSRAVLDACDENLYIPYGNDFRNALNASSAASILAFEVLRQRRKAGI